MDYFILNWNWDYMCGPSGLQPWNETTKDLGLCFQEICLQIPLSFVIAAISAFYIGYRKDWVIRDKTQDNALTIRSLIVLGLVFIPIVEMYIFVTTPSYTLYPVDYFSAGASSLSWLIHFGYVLALKHRLGPSSRGPLSMILSWSISVIFSVIALRSCLLSGETSSFYLASIICHAVYCLTLIPSSDSRPTYYSRCLVGSQHNHSEYTPLLPQYDEGILGVAMQDTSCLSRLLFNWVKPICVKGRENKLNDIEELHDVPVDVRCSYVGAKLDRALIGNMDHYQQYEDVPHEPFISTSYGATAGRAQASTPVTPTARVPRRARARASLLRALHACFARQFYSVGALKLLADCASFAAPLLLNKLIVFVQDKDVDPHYGYLYAAGLLSSTLLSALLNTHFNWHMALVGLKMRGAVVHAVLRKVLSVTSTELNKAFSVGEVTNFMSTDTDRIVNSCPSFHALWSIPLQLFVTLFLLYQQVGLSFLAGVAFSVILIPFNKLIANRIGVLSTELMRHKDERVSTMSDLLRGIRTIKLHVWEDYFIDKVTETRGRELSALRGRKYLDAVCVLLWASTPAAVAALTLGTHALRRAPLDAPTVFTTVALVNMLIAPLNAFPWVLNGLTEAWVSVRRIQTLLDLPEMDPELYYDRLNTNQDEDKMIIIKNATFSWAKPSKRIRPPKKTKGKKRKESVEPDEPDHVFTLEDISLEIGRGELVVVTGAVGSGKTSLLHAIMGDMIKKSGNIQIPECLDSFGYVPQRAWLTRGGVRDNVLFGRAYDEPRYRAVLEACALTEDLDSLGWGAAVGEAGSALSGGQRARLALARAMYQDKQVYLLDDVLSAVDARVARHVLARGVLGALAGRTRVLVTHDAHVLRRATRVIVLEEGRVVRDGPPELVLSELEAGSSDEARAPPPPPGPSGGEDGGGGGVDPDEEEEEEGMAQGAVAWWVARLYARAAGLPLCAAVLLSLVLMQASNNFTFLWLTFWLRNRENATSVQHPVDGSTVVDHGVSALDGLIHALVNGTARWIHAMDGPANKLELNTSAALANPLEATWRPLDDYYLQMYAALVGVSLLCTALRAFLFAHGGVLAAAAIHRMLLKVIVKAKVSFFDATPAGRVLNRFSSDTYTVDDSLPFILNILLAQFFALLGAVVMTVYGLPWALAGVAPTLPAYWWLAAAYRPAARQLKRLHCTQLTPLYSHFHDTLEGITTIRALSGGSGRWLRLGAERAERAQRAALAGAAAAGWLAVRLQAAALLVPAAAALSAVLERDAAAVGLALSYALTVAGALGGVLSACTEVERELVAVERVGEYIRQVEPERVEGAAPPYGWPSQGVVAFDDVSLDYSRASGPHRALDHVTFATRPGEKVGVAGRSGAGKSSLLAAAVRLPPAAAGAVTVDGVDVATLDLRALRSRIAVLPQEPFIFAGSVRDNVDPLRAHGDAAVRRALLAAGAAAAVAARGGLHAPAAGVSRGLAQLLCLARATLQRTKILLIDEATANIDAEAERAILDTLRHALPGVTVLFVSHRVRGVLECDRVLVLGAGRVLEHDAPDALLSDPTSALHALVHAHDG